MVSRCRLLLPSGQRVQVRCCRLSFPLGHGAQVQCCPTSAWVPEQATKAIPEIRISTFRILLFNIIYA